MFTSAQKVPQSPGIKRVIMISIDSCNPEYISQIYVPNLYERVIRDGIKFKFAKSILSSETQAGHTSQLTGSYPTHSGIIGNGLYFPHDWIDNATGKVAYPADTEIFTFTDPRLRLTKTIFEQFENNNSVHTAMISGKWRLIPLLSPGADYVFGNPKNGSVQAEYGPNATEYNNGVGAPFTYIEGDAIDTWSMNALLQVLRSKADVEFYFTNLAFLDDVQHCYGGYNEYVNHELRELDNLFLQLFSYLESVGEYDSTLFVITADHGSEQTKFILNLFDILENSASPHIKAHIFAEGQAAYIWLNNTAQLQDALALLQKQDGVGLVVPRDNSSVTGYDNYSKYHLYPGRNRTGDIYVSTKENGATVIRPNVPMMLNGIHGGISTQDVPLAFICKNAAFKPTLKGYEIMDEVPNTVDIIPTIAHLMNWKLDKMTLDGTVLPIFQ